MKDQFKTKQARGSIELILSLLVIILLMAMPVVAQDQKPKDTLVIAISSDFEPFTFLNAEGKPAGMLVDIWQLWAKKTGKQIQFISSDWKTSLENLKNQKADIHSGQLYSPEHIQWISVSQPFYEVGVSLFYPVKQGKISDIKELTGQSIAVISGSQLEQFLKKNYPGIRIYPCDTREDLVKVSREGKTKGFVAIWPVGSALIDRMGLSGEFRTYDKILYKEKFLSGVLKGNTELLALVNKGLGAISLNEMADIEARWIPDPAKRYYKTSNIIQLTPAEETWLRNHKTIRVGMSPIFPPLKFTEKGIIKGIEPDYLTLLSEYTGIQFEYVICGLDMMDEKVKSGEIDMFLSFFISERLSHTTLTEPFMEFKQVIVARIDAPFMSGIGSLKGKKVATGKGMKLYEKLLAPYPEIEAVPVNNMEEMFKAVSESKADALITKTYLAGYVIHHYPNLKIAGVADLPPEPYHYAVRKDYPELVGILNKAIQSIPKDRFDAIVQKWFSVRVEYRPNWSEILKWALVIGGSFTLILGLSLFWNRRLSREIDKRKQTEEGLSESEERFRKLFEHMNSGVAIYEAVDDGEDFLFRDFNAAGETIEHVKREDIIGKRVTEAFPGVIEFGLLDVLKRVLKTGESEYFPARLYKNERDIGTWRESWVYKLPSGEIVAIYNDITDRMQAEEALRRSEENFRRSLTDSPMGVRIVTVKGESFYANRAILDIYGYDSIEDLKTTPAEKRYTPESHADFLIRREKRQQGVDVTSEYTINIIRKDGEIRHLNVLRRGILWDGERQFQVIYQDITERKRAEEALKESEDKYRLITDNSCDWIYLINPDGKFKYVSPSCERVTGYSSVEFINNPKLLLDIIHPDDKEQIKSHLETVKHEAKDHNMEFSIITKEGELRWIIHSCVPVYNDQGKYVGRSGTNRDITDRKWAEENLRISRQQLRALAERLQQIREEERVLVSREIHDVIGGGLTGLKMDLSWLIHNVKNAESDEEQAAFKSKILISSEYIDQLIKETRRISTGLRPPFIDDLGLISAIDWELSEFTSRTGILHELTTQFEYVNIQKDKAVGVFRIFQETLTNIVRHSRATKVVVVLREDERSLFGDEKLVLEIRDNGRGISEEEILNPKSLGLLGMKERAMALEGEFSIRGEPGGGTTVVLKIPRKKGETS